MTDLDTDSAVHADLLVVRRALVGLAAESGPAAQAECAALLRLLQRPLDLLEARLVAPTPEEDVH